MEALKPFRKIKREEGKTMYTSTTQLIVKLIEAYYHNTNKNCL